MRERQRRRYWIDVRAQAPFLLKFCSIWAGGIILLCLLMYYLADEELGRSFYSIHLRIRNTWQILLPAVLVSGGISSLLTIGATVWVAIRESHRLIGPAFKFNRLFRQLAEGYFDADFRFRKGDLLQDMGEAYREALMANRERVRLLQELSRKAEWKAGALQEALQGRSLSVEERTLVAETADIASRLREAAAAFRAGTA
ncbi:MAG: hypothetical protein M1550_04770 [Deltaproteobacteria bacterium]|nr:hypothetical protein [Deltaproteobacteria bacterium]